ncbi:hypothetical protein GCM10010151_53900 [Actinoallomurus spadix]|uniref:UVR domain-containing protein n=1 Tax=Actinoallomurus spadix TaxID=79912 RepID=A0ABN0X7Z1_9ACTN
MAAPSTTTNVREEPRPVSRPEVRRLDERIAELRRRKEEAVDGRDYERAAAVREAEKALLADRLLMLRRAEHRNRSGPGS